MTFPTGSDLGRILNVPSMKPINLTSALNNLLTEFPPDQIAAELLNIVKHRRETAMKEAASKTAEWDTIQQVFAKNFPLPK